MIFSDIHVHTTYCDGKNSAEETVLAALEKNFVSIGFSGHSYTSFESGWCMSEEGTEKYIGENGWKIKFFIPFNFVDKHFRTTERNFRGNCASYSGTSSIEKNGVRACGRAGKSSGDTRCAGAESGGQSSYYKACNPGIWP